MATKKQEYVNQYNKDNYCNMGIRMRRHQKAVLEQHMEARGIKSLNAYILRLIAADMEGEEYQADFVAGGTKSRDPEA